MGYARQEEGLMDMAIEADYIELKEGKNILSDQEVFSIMKYFVAFQGFDLISVNMDLNGRISLELRNAYS